MARIKELLEKKKAGTISDDELKELDTLQKEAQEAQEDPDKDKETENEEEAIDKLADQLVSKATSRVDALLEKLEKAADPKPQVKVTNETKMIFDRSLGKNVAVEDLKSIKVDIPNREGKKTKQVTKHTLEFLSALIEGDKQKLQLLVEGTGARGGFLVPEDFANMIVEDIRDEVVMRQIADVMTTTSDTLHLPNLSSRPKASWRSEGAVKSTSTVDFGETVFTPYSLAVIVGLTNELIADATLGVSPSIVNYVAQLMTRSLAEKEETAFWTGNGSGQPTGIDNYSLRTLTASPTDASRADTIKQAYFRTPQGYRSRSVWAMNSATMEKVATLKDSQGNYLLSRLADNPTFSLAGRPVYEVNDLGGGKAFFGDFSYYKIVDREGISVRISDEATVASQSAFERNLTFVRVEKRVDAELTLTQPITELAGLGTP